MRNKVNKNKFVSIVLITFFVFGLFAFNTFEGGSCAGVTWTYNPSTNTATASGTGTTNFSELVQADIDGGWGGVYTADTTGTQIKCTGKIIIGDGTNVCSFSDINKQILENNSLTSGDFFIEVKNNSILTFGVLVDELTKTTRNGCNLFSTSGYNTYLISSNSGGICNFYSSTFGFSTANYQLLRSTKGNIFHCQFLGLALVNFGGDIYDSYHVAISGSSDKVGLNVPYNALVNKISLNGFGRGLATYLKDNIYSNVVMRNIVTYEIFSTYQNGDNYFINPDFSSWRIGWNNYISGKIYRQYTFNLNVLNGEITDFVENATVQLWKDSNLVYEGVTNNSGMIPTQTLTYGYYQQSTGNTIQNATSPYYLVISHPDWQTYISRFYITEPLRLTVSMQTPEGEGVGVEAVAFGVVVFVVVGVFVLLALFVRRRGSSGFG